MGLVCQGDVNNVSPVIMTLRQKKKKHLSIPFELYTYYHYI